MKKFFIAPSILSANFAQLGLEVQSVLTAGSDIIHFDVMDNHYVSNLTFGPMVLRSLRNYNITEPIDVHLMTKPVDNLITEFATAGANFISFHPEATHNVIHTINLIKKNGCKAGIAINPTESLNILDGIIDELDIVLLMGVQPGFAGQKFIPSVLHKIVETRKYIDQFNSTAVLEVDGGIYLDNIIDIASAGADIFVMGSAIFSSINYQQTIQDIRNKLNILNYKNNSF